MAYQKWRCAEIDWFLHGTTTFTVLSQASAHGRSADLLSDSSHFSMVGSYTENHEKPQNCQNCVGGGHLHEYGRLPGTIWSENQLGFSLGGEGSDLLIMWVTCTEQVISNQLTIKAANVGADHRDTKQLKVEHTRNTVVHGLLCWMIVPLRE